MPRAIVTGASSGLGMEIAKQLDRQGYQLDLVARSKESLEQLANSLQNARAIVADLSTSDGVEIVTASGEAPDLLVNNAGFGGLGPFAESDPEMVQRMIAVNCGALTALTQAYLPKMLSRNSGTILNIASTASFQAGPNQAVYCASKAYVLSFTEAVAEEVRKSAVKIVAFCPGAFDSGFQEAAHAGNARLFKGRKLKSSAEIADAALGAMDGSHVVVVPGLSNKVGAQATRFVPRFLTRRVVAAVQAEA